MIPLLKGGERVEAKIWNRLFEELDGKLTKLLGGRSFLVTGTGGPGELGSVLGKVFWMSAGPRSDALRARMGGLLYGAYETSRSELVIDAEGVEVLDEAKRVAVLKESVPLALRVAVGATQGFFGESLVEETMFLNPHPDETGAKEERFWLLEPGYYRPAWRAEYGLAEVVCEAAELRGEQRAQLRYGFLRIHNMLASQSRVVLTAPRDDGTRVTILDITLPPEGCRCVRWDGGKGVYVEGFNYFPKFEEGDPTVFHVPLDRRTPHGSMGANPVVNPSIIYNFVGLFAPEHLGAPSLRLDPHQLDDVGELYRPYYATE